MTRFKGVRKLTTKKYESLRKAGQLDSGILYVTPSASEGADLSEYVKNTDYATASKGGVVKAQNVNTANRGVYVSSEGFLSLKVATEKEIQDKSSATYNVISPANLDKAVKVGLTTNKEEFTAEDKQAARTLIGAVGSEDYASYDTFGVVKLKTSGGLIADKGTLQIYKANDNEIAAKEHGFKPIVPANVDMAVKVGVTTNTIPLTDEEKASAKAWLGVDESGGITEIALSDLEDVTQRGLYYLVGGYYGFLFVSSNDEGGVSQYLFTAMDGIKYRSISSAGDWGGWRYVETRLGEPS